MHRYHYIGRWWRVMWVAGCASLMMGGLVHAVAAKSFPGIEKVSTGLQADWQQHQGWVAGSTWAECFVRVAGKVSPEHRKELRAAGFFPRSEIPVVAAGASESIITGHLRMRDLPKLAKLEFVTAIEGAVLLTPKSSVKGKAPTQVHK